MSASITFLIFGFSVFSWFIGFWFIKFEIYNPTFGRASSVSDILTCYQALMLGMFTIIAIISMLPKVIRALTVGYEIISVIDREPKIISPKDKSLLVNKIMINFTARF